MSNFDKNMPSTSSSSNFTAADAQASQSTSQQPQSSPMGTLQPVPLLCLVGNLELSSSSEPSSLTSSTSTSPATLPAFFSELFLVTAFNSDALDKLINGREKIEHEEEKRLLGKAYKYAMEQLGPASQNPALIPSLVQCVVNEKHTKGVTTKFYQNQIALTTERDSGEIIKLKGEIANAKTSHANEMALKEQEIDRLKGTIRSLEEEKTRSAAALITANAALAAEGAAKNQALAEKTAMEERHKMRTAEFENKVKELEEEQAELMRVLNLNVKEVENLEKLNSALAAGQRNHIDHFILENQRAQFHAQRFCHILRQCREELVVARSAEGARQQELTNKNLELLNSPSKIIDLEKKVGDHEKEQYDVSRKRTVQLEKARKDKEKLKKQDAEKEAAWNRDKANLETRVRELVGTVQEKVKALVDAAKDLGQAQQEKLTAEQKATNLESQLVMVNGKLTEVETKLNEKKSEFDALKNVKEALDGEVSLLETQKTTAEDELTKQAKLFKKAEEAARSAFDGEKQTLREEMEDAARKKQMDHDNELQQRNAAIRTLEAEKAAAQIKMQALKELIEAKMDALQETVDNRLDVFVKRLGWMENMMNELIGRLQKLEEKCADVEKKLDDEKLKSEEKLGELGRQKDEEIRKLGLEAERERDHFKGISEALSQKNEKDNENYTKLVRDGMKNFWQNLNVSLDAANAESRTERKLLMASTPLQDEELSNAAQVQIPRQPAAEPESPATLAPAPTRAAADERIQAPEIKYLYEVYGSKPNNSLYNSTDETFPTHVKKVPNIGHLQRFINGSRAAGIQIPADETGQTLREKLLVEQKEQVAMGYIVVKTGLNIYMVQEEAKRQGVKRRSAAGDEGSSEPAAKRRRSLKEDEPTFGPNQPSTSSAG